MKRICSCNVNYYFHQISTVNGVNGKITKKHASVLSAIASFLMNVFTSLLHSSFQRKKKNTLIQIYLDF